MQKINDLLRKKSGIYSIMNIANGKIYIGSSKDIYNRLHEHLHLLNANSAHNKYLQNAWNKYGQECFIYNVLELCSENSRFEKEQYYMDFMNPEYNKTSQVIANFGQTTSEEVREKISKTLSETLKQNGRSEAYRKKISDSQKDRQCFKKGTKITYTAGANIDKINQLTADG